MIRVLFAGPPGPRDALRQAMTSADDFDVVGAVASPVDALVRAGAARADVVVVSGGVTSPPGVVSHLLAEYPDITVVGVGPGAGRATVYFLQSREVLLTAGSPADLLRALQTFLQQRGEQT